MIHTDGRATIAMRQADKLLGWSASLDTERKTFQEWLDQLPETAEVDLGKEEAA
jgi:hypothetical protein